MKYIISKSFAAYTMIGILSLATVFHLLVITGLVPFGIVWGGRLQTHGDMLVFESVSILLNLLMLAVVCIRAGIFGANIKTGLISFLLWLICLVFALNTIGNLFSENQFEKLFFTPVTILLTLLSARLALAGNKVGTASAVVGRVSG